MDAHLIVSRLLGEDGPDPDSFVSDFAKTWASRLRTAGTFEVNSSVGRFIVDQNGDIVYRELFEPDNPEAEGASKIVKFDLDEWRRSWQEDPVRARTIDILDLGFWDTDGGYTPPEEEWRVNWHIRRG